MMTETKAGIRSAFIGSLPCAASAALVTGVLVNYPNLFGSWEGKEITSFWHFIIGGIAVIAVCGCTIDVSRYLTGRLYLSSDVVAWDGGRAYEDMGVEMIKVTGLVFSLGVALFAASIVGYLYDLVSLRPIGPVVGMTVLYPLMILGTGFSLASAVEQANKLKRGLR
mgnify:CR=1 FL=1